MIGDARSHPTIMGQLHRCHQRPLRSEAGSTHDIIYVRGISDPPSPDLTSFDGMKCSNFIVEIGLYQDLGCEDKGAKKYSLLVVGQKTLWDRVDFVDVPIGHAVTTILTTRKSLVNALSVDHHNVSGTSRRQKDSHGPQHGR